MEGAEGIRPLWDNHDTGWRGLVRVACRRSHRQNRYRERRRFDGAASQVRGRATADLVGFQGPFVGEFLEKRGNRSICSDEKGREGLEPAEEQGRLLRNLCRQQ